MRILTRDIGGHVGEEITLMGSVDVRRDHGKLIFIDFRDWTGLAQVVFLPNNKELHEKASQIRSEWVIELKGSIQKRPEGLVNKNMASGEYEIVATGFEILSEAKTPPFDVHESGLDIGEETRMKYRYVDLRRSRMQKNLRNRFKVFQTVRNFLSENDFVEVETPVLSKSTPEGARDYLVPSRTQEGKFYALPQSPQQYKQLLMVSGIDRYFQIARCYRDEDTRGDRQPEFTQLDLEMSFVNRDDVMAVNEELLIKIVKELYPEKKIQEIPFPRITYKDAIEKYGNDRPDMRTDKDDPNLLAFCWVIDFPFFEKTDNGGWTFTHNPFSAPKPEFMSDLLEKKNIGEIITTQYDIALNGWEIGGGSIRNHRSEALRAVFNVMGFDDERIDKNFGHMLEAFDFGAPPHGGIAWGMDRLMMILEGEANIREVIAFPKTGDGRDFMMDAPSDVSEEQLKELHIKIVKTNK
ncbi:MAG: aspartate--tRNA ligase [Candidatus Jorgensenbacteria bacterium]|nr:aspartate--tRNA ligase [Candidatus Jorgensenbacteria bacterium]